MSNKDTDKKEVLESLVTVEKLKEKLKLDDAVYSGVLAYKGWVEGKKITEAEMNKAVNEFLHTPLK